MPDNFDFNHDSHLSINSHVSISSSLFYCRFIKNCVPRQDGILIGAGISITYIVLSLISLVLLFGIYETVSYGIKSVMYWTKIGCLLYGITITILGILIFVLDVPAIPGNVILSWTAMSQY